MLRAVLELGTACRWLTSRPPGVSFRGLPLAQTGLISRRLCHGKGNRDCCVPRERGGARGRAGKPELLGIRRTRGAACGKAQRHEATALLLASGELGLLSRVGWKEGREGNARVGPQEVAELVCLFLFFMSEFQGGRERFREVTPVQIVLPSL